MLKCLDTGAPISWSVKARTLTRYNSQSLFTSYQFDMHTFVCVSVSFDVMYQLESPLLQSRYRRMPSTTKKPTLTRPSHSATSAPGTRQITELVNSVGTSRFGDIATVCCVQKCLILLYFFPFPWLPYILIYGIIESRYQSLGFS